ncbi:MAG TPA: hypothetical protein VKV20_00960 [Ktedonobacteraceae bacterium]|jgi:hypothetical protein|nr:hypothetical protein [Ktedonobacteraceae bacterium]
MIKRKLLPLYQNSEQSVESITDITRGAITDLDKLTWVQGRSELPFQSDDGEAVSAHERRFWPEQVDHAPTYPYEPGIQVTFGCRALKNLCKESIVPRANSTIFVISLAPEHSWLAACTGLAEGVGAPTFGVAPAWGEALPVGLH